MKNNSGFIFLEVVISVALISIAFISLLGVGLLVLNVSESIKKQTMASSLIKEEFEWLSNLLGIGGKGVISTFKTNIAKKLIDKFIPGGSDSWLGGIVANSIGNIPLGDYFNGNILKCDFVSKEITKSISEEVLTKVQQNKDLTGGFYDVIKNSLMEYIDDTPFFNKIQEGVSAMICPYMEDISGSLGKAFGSVTGDLKQEFTGTK
jgi:hypothetical protein